MKLASIFTDHMVLQANQSIKIFGEGQGVGEITFLGKTVAFSFEQDEWCVSLPAADYGGPYEMDITLDNVTYKLKDIYIGEVWLACGQSNMEQVLFKTEYGIEEAKHAYNDKIRFFTVPRRTERNTPKCGWHSDKVTGEDRPWEICTEESALHFSAIGYYVAKELQERLNIAIGVISCNWGGVPIETYISRDYFSQLDCLKPQLEEYNAMLRGLNWDLYKAAYRKGIREWDDYYHAIDYDVVDEVREKGVRACIGMPLEPTPCMPDGPYVPQMPGCLYDSMIARIAPFGVKGMMWYQGESNQSLNYLDKYLLFMRCMCDTFKNPDMVFYAVELASFSYFGGEDEQTTDNRFVVSSNLAFTREQQQRATEVASNNYLITSMELGDLYDIHPVQKRELAHRMVLKMFKYTYGLNVYADHPTYRSAEFKNGKVYIHLNHSDGLYCRYLSGVKMYVADESHQLKRAKIEIKNDMLILSCNEVKTPILARYGFDYYYSGCHIYNKAGLPLAPFRTDK